MPPTSNAGVRGNQDAWMRGASMPTLARSILTGWTDRVVDDRTGLSGGYDLDLNSRRVPEPRLGRPRRPEILYRSLQPWKNSLD